MEKWKLNLEGVALVASAHGVNAGGLVLIGARGSDEATHNPNVANPFSIMPEYLLK